MCWDCTKTDEACGWPQRTVRAIIAISSIFIIFSTCCALIVILAINEQYQSAISIAGALLGIVGSIIGYYFGSHANNTTATTTGKQNIPDIENKVLAEESNHPNELSELLEPNSSNRTTGTTGTTGISNLTEIH